MGTLDALKRAIEAGSPVRIGYTGEAGDIYWCGPIRWMTASCKTVVARDDIGCEWVFKYRRGSGRHALKGRPETTMVIEASAFPGGITGTTSGSALVDPAVLARRRSQIRKRLCDGDAREEQGRSERNTHRLDSAAQRC